MCLFISRLKANFRDLVKEADKSGRTAEIVIEINEGQGDATVDGKGKMDFKEDKKGDGFDDETSVQLDNEARPKPPKKKHQ